MSVKRNHLAVVVSLIVSCWLSTAVATASPLLATTDIQTVVCGADATPQLTIDSLLSDSTIGTLRIPVQGTVLHVSQLIISLDGQYDQTVSLPAGAERYETVVTASPGTRTIQIEAIGICGESKIDSVVITVAPTNNPGPTTIETLSPQPLTPLANSSGVASGVVRPLDAFVASTGSAVSNLTRLSAPLLFLFSVGLTVYAYSGHHVVFHRLLSPRVGRMILIVIGVSGISVALLLNR